jgi:hypothetical protein
MVVADFHVDDYFPHLCIDRLLGITNIIFHFYGFFVGLPDFSTDIDFCNSGFYSLSYIIQIDTAAAVKYQR